MESPLRVETRAGSPVLASGRQITPYSKALIFKIPGLRGGLIWNRPASVLVTEADGREWTIPVVDVTRQALWAFWGASALFALIAVLVAARKKTV